MMLLSVAVAGTRIWHDQCKSTIAIPMYVCSSASTISCELVRIMETRVGERRRLGAVFVNLIMLS
jgi:hypothetical protein